MEGGKLTLNVWIYDDSSSFVEDCISKLNKIINFRKKYTIRRFDDDTYEKEIKILNNRRIQLREDGEIEEEKANLDDAVIFIIEYDLQESFDPFLSGEDVAYLTRCFSGCQYIIGLNQYEGRQTEKSLFDLTLKGHINSFCDLNIGSNQLNNPGLWDHDFHEYRPWHWPCVPKYIDTLTERVEEVKKTLRTPVCDILDITDDIRFFPKSITQFFGNNPLKTTFYDIVFNSGNGLRRKDQVKDEDQIARIAVARISKWIERLVIPGQNIFVDGPHLVSRFPSLLREDHTIKEEWDKTASFNDFDKLGMKHELIEDQRYKKSYWISRPVWYWKKILQNKDIPEITQPWEREITELVFCEDASTFWPETECKEFRIDSDSPYNERYIRSFDAVDYQPSDRLHLITPP